jgi:hypothetical protein
VVVKARVVRLNPQGRGARAPKMRVTMSRAVDAHFRYLERDGVTRDGERGKAYSVFDNEVDGKAFVERGREDCHQFRFIVCGGASINLAPALADDRVWNDRYPEPCRREIHDRRNLGGFLSQGSG